MPRNPPVVRNHHASQSSMGVTAFALVFGPVALVIGQLLFDRQLWPWQHTRRKLGKWKSSPQHTRSECCKRMPPIRRAALVECLSGLMPTNSP